jgi:hypothetical protein
MKNLWCRYSTSRAMNSMWIRSWKLPYFVLIVSTCNPATMSMIPLYRNSTCVRWWTWATSLTTRMSALEICSLLRSYVNEAQLSSPYGPSKNLKKNHVNHRHLDTFLMKVSFKKETLKHLNLSAQTMLKMGSTGCQVRTWCSSTGRTMMGIWRWGTNPVTTNASINN